MFNNLYFFAMTRPFTTTQDDLNDSLSNFEFTPCASTEMSHFGFVPALCKGLGECDEPLAHEAAGNILICARKEEKILPGPVIKSALDEQCGRFEHEQGRKPSKKERAQFKEDIIFDLLPRAFSRITETSGYINAELNLLVIDASSRGKAEDFMALLRKALGTLPVTSFTPSSAPDEVMTDWLSSNVLDGQAFITNQFTFGMRAEFKAIGDDGAVAKVSNQDLSGDEVKAHLDAEKYVTKVGIKWQASMSFTLCDDLAIKQLKFTDVIAEQNDDMDSDDKLARLDADFVLYAGEVNRMIVDLLGEFGLNTSDYLDQSSDKVG